MTPQEPHGSRHEDGDPLLVRPFLLHDNDTSDTAAAWPSAETWPSASLTGTREILSHRADKKTPPAVSPAPARRRRTLLLAAAGAAALLGLAGAGYGMLQPTSGGDVPIPSGALPPLASASPGDSPIAPAPPPGGKRTAAPGRTPAKASPTTAEASSPSAGPRSTAPSATGAATTVAPAPQTPGFVAGLAPAPAAARVGAIAGDGNLCLDLNGGVPVDDNHVQVFVCNGGPAQRWTLATDGTLQVVGKCAQVTADSTVHIIGCDDRAQSQWRAGVDGALVNVATGQCLTDPEAGARSGAGVRVASCTAGDNQRWSLP